MKYLISCLKQFNPNLSCARRQYSRGIILEGSSSFPARCGIKDLSERNRPSLRDFISAPLLTIENGIPRFYLPWFSIIKWGECRSL